MPQIFFKEGENFGLLATGLASGMAGFRGPSTIIRLCLLAPISLCFSLCRFQPQVDSLQKATEMVTSIIRFMFSLTLRVLENLPWFLLSVSLSVFEKGSHWPVWITCPLGQSLFSEEWVTLVTSGVTSPLWIQGFDSFTKSHAEWGKGCSPEKDMTSVTRRRRNGAGKNNRCPLHMFWISCVTQALPWERALNCVKTFLCDRHFVFVIFKNCSALWFDHLVDSLFCLSANTKPSKLY